MAYNGLDGQKVQMKGNRAGLSADSATLKLHSTFFVCRSFGIVCIAATGDVSVVLSDVLLLSIACFCSPKSSLRCSAGLIVPISLKNL